MTPIRTQPPCFTIIINKDITQSRLLDIFWLCADSVRISSEKINTCEPQEAYAKLPAKMIKKLCDLRRHAVGGAASEGFA
jgi:hypothetical protein